MESGSLDGPGRLRRSEDGETGIELRVLEVDVVGRNSSGLPAVLEAEALPVHLQDMDMVGEAVEESPGEPFRAEDLGPLVEGQV